MSSDSVDGGTLTRSYDPETTDTCVAVVMAVAAAKQTDVHSLSPLATTVEPDALDALGNGRNPGCKVEFVYEGCHVVVEGGRIVVTPESRV